MVAANDLESGVVYYQATLWGVDDRMFVGSQPGHTEGQYPVYVFSEVGGSRRPYNQNRFDLETFHSTESEAWAMVVEKLRERLTAAEARYAYLIAHPSEVQTDDGEPNA